MSTITPATYNSMQVGITLDSGETVMLENYPTSLVELVETSGAVGTTNVLLSQLQALG